MTTIVRDPLLRALQGEADVLYRTEDDIVLAKFDSIKIEVSRNSNISLQFMKDYNLVAYTPAFGLLSPGRTVYLSMRGGAEATLRSNET